MMRFAIFPDISKNTELASHRLKDDIQNLSVHLFVRDCEKNVSNPVQDCFPPFRQSQFMFRPFALGDVADALDRAYNVARLIVQGRGLGKNPCALIVVEGVAKHFRQ